MTIKQNNTTIHTLTYRYTKPDTGQTTTSKLSIDCFIYDILKKNEDNLTPLLEYKQQHAGDRLKSDAKTCITDRWLYSTAGAEKEQNINIPFAGYMREFLLRQIIKPELLEGYEISPQYVKLWCDLDEVSNTTLRIPDSLYHAVKTSHGKDIDDLLREQYRYIRDNSPSNENYILKFRQELLKKVMRPELIH